MRSGARVTTLQPSRRSYFSQQKPMSEAAIDSGFTRDLYATLGDALNATTWLVRVQHKPFVNWIWGGALLMALGGLFAASDRRYRIAVRGVRAEKIFSAAPVPRETPGLAAQKTTPWTREAENG
jgi:cytochrome c-type biogenesis protein CcmF